MRTLLLDIAWLAGILEGEGCFKIQTSGGYKGSICIATQMSDEDTVKKIATIMQGTLWGPHGPYGVSKLQTYQTAVFGSKAAAWMMTVFPFMGVRRQTKIKELLTMWREQPLRIKGRKAICHTDRRYYVRGLCKPCARRVRYLTKGD